MAILSQVEHASLNLNSLRRMAPGLPANALPPKTTQILLASLIDLQPRFIIFPSHGTFNTAGLGKTTRPEFIENEPWIGYYCYSMATSDVEVDAMMSDVTIKCIAQDVVSTELEGQGVGGCGGFDIRGVLHRATGLMTLIKQYRQDTINTEWRWDAVMTPFGIVGTRGRIPWGGWFWL